MCVCTRLFLHNYGNYANIWCPLYLKKHLARQQKIKNTNIDKTVSACFIYLFIYFCCCFNYFWEKVLHRLSLSWIVCWNHRCGHILDTVCPFRKFILFFLPTIQLCNNFLSNWDIYWYNGSYLVYKYEWWVDKILDLIKLIIERKHIINLQK